MATSRTGYGPSASIYSTLCFDGDDAKFELWEIKFISFLRLEGLSQYLEPDVTVDDEYHSKNSEIFARLTQFLDDKSLSIILRDAKDDGKASLKILREHYIGSSKPKIISLYTELTSMQLKDDENTTDYVIRAEKAVNALKNAGETISDSLIMSMLLKGLPENYKSFCTVVTQSKEDYKFVILKLLYIAMKNLKSVEITM